MSGLIKIFAPATIANVGPGFDIFGLALNGIGDTVEMELLEEPGIVIENGTGCADLPSDPAVNVAGVAITAMLKSLSREKQGVRIRINKNIMPGSGLGSSASSAAASVFGLNHLLDNPFRREELIPFAMEGEGAVSHSPHADNVSPSLLGGFTVVRSYEPLDVIRIDVKINLWFTVVHPQIEVKTSDSKRMLKREISLQQGVRQWGNVAGVIAALMGGDAGLLSRALHDPLVEPVRSMLIPGFDQAKEAALATGALGCTISGSGPSIFAACADEKTAHLAAAAFEKIYQKLSIEHNLYVSELNKEGCIIIP